MSAEFEQSSDDILITQVALGHAEAFAALFRRRRADVFRFALHLTGAPALAEDVTQDVFVIVMREAGKYQPGRSTVAAWLCGIARNCARQRLERDRGLTSIGHDSTGTGDESLDSDANLPAVHPDPLGDLTRAERLAMLRRAVLALPLRYREVVVLCDLQELSYAEAADALGCAIGTVRSRLHRARGLLAVRMTALESASSEAPQASRRSSPATGPALGRPEHKRCLA
jgi:RNA polymerase sigma-70 factor, ECF subfamily